LILWDFFRKPTPAAALAPERKKGGIPASTLESSGEIAMVHTNQKLSFCSAAFIPCFLARWIAKTPTRPIGNGWGHALGLKPRAVTWKGPARRSARPGAPGRRPLVAGHPQTDSGVYRLHLRPLEKLTQLETVPRGARLRARTGPAHTSCPGRSSRQSPDCGDLRDPDHRGMILGFILGVLFYSSF
jgi:hypothetical protein